MTGTTDIIQKKEKNKIETGNSSGKRKRRLLEASSSQRKYQTISPEYIEADSDTSNETRFHIIIKWKDTKYKMLVDAGGTHSYIGKNFLNK